jgi:hypothetical protein
MTSKPTPGETTVKKTSTLTRLFALAALVVLFAAPVFAATPDAAAAAVTPEPAAEATPELPLFLPEAEAAMGNGSCHGQFTEITNYYIYILSQSECDTLCTDWCDGEGGTLKRALWSLRGADCGCYCCVPK